MKKAKTAKGVAEKQAAAKLLVNVPDEYVFYCNDGQVFRNMGELSNGLKHMSDETFSYHSNCDKHDFSNWLKDVVGDERLAADLVDAASQAEAEMIVSARIKFLQSE